MKEKIIDGNDGFLQPVEVCTLCTSVCTRTVTLNAQKSNPKRLEDPYSISDFGSISNANWI
jgi:hypothetical protein